MVKDNKSTFWYERCAIALSSDSTACCGQWRITRKFLILSEVDIMTIYMFGFNGFHQISSSFVDRHDVHVLSGLENASDFALSWSQLYYITGTVRLRC